jgi:uncharacterized repeat protein (TIGR01451 family)
MHRFLHRPRSFWLRLLAGPPLAAVAAYALAQSLATSHPLDMCPGDRAASDLGCTAKDVQITSISISPGSTAPATCEGGSTLTLDLDVTVQFGASVRYDVGIFLSQDGALPQDRSTRTFAGGTGSASCKVSTLPVGPFVHLDGGPYTIGGQSVTDLCGDGSKATIGGGTGAATFTIPAVTVKCQALNSGGALNIPFVVTWDHQSSPTGAVCLGSQHPTAGTGSKCNAPDGTQGDVAVVTVPRITKTDALTAISPSDTTTYTVTISNTTGIVLTNAVFKDPAVANLAVGSVSCAAQGGASCPASTTVAGMQGAGLTIPTMPLGSSVVFTINAQLTGNPTGTLVNSASVTTNGVTNTATDSNAIVYPNLVNTKSATVLSDPVNGTTNPKSIPGAEALYTISVANTGQGRVDSNTVAVADAIPANTSLYVGNLGGAGSGPVTYAESGSNLAYTYASLGSSIDDLEFSSNGGATWTYVPVADASGYDAAVTNLRVRPKGRMAGWSGAGAYPSFTLTFKVKLK